MPDPTPYLLYLGPIRQSSNSDVERIARLVADHASVNLDGTYRVTDMSDADELADYDGAAVIAPNGDEVLYVVNVPYRRALRLDEQGQPTGRTALFGNMIRSTKLFLLASIRLRRAWRRSEAKSRRAKVQLAVGLMYVVVLAILVLLAALALAGALWPEQFPWINKENKGPRIALGVFGLSATLGTIYAFVRRRSAPVGRVAQALLHYVENADTRKEAARALERAIDRLDERSEAGRHPKFHVLGYSFGSIVALDSLCPPAGSARGRRLDRVSSIATVGCPADFIRLYYPDYFDGRMTLSGDVQWHNLFIANDVLGSNFLDSEGSDKETEPAQGVATRPAGLIHPTANFSFGAPELTKIELLKREGFVLHARYWHEDYKSSILDVLMPLWPPMSRHQSQDEAAGA